MTTEHHAQPPEGHLDGEAASAALDGETTDAEAAHLRRCDRCQATVDELRAVQAAVAERPPLVPAPMREASIAAALEAFDDGSQGDSTDESADGEGVVATLRDRPRFAAGPWLGIAAVLLLLVVAIPLIARGGSGDDGETAATDSAAEESTALAAPDEGFTDVGDLGELDAGADLRSVVDRALSERAAPPAPAAAMDDDQGFAQRTTSDRAAGDDAGARVSGGGTGTELEQDLQAAAGRPSREAAEACLEPVRADLGELGALVLAGTGRVDGEPALVLGFDAVDAERPTVIVVLVVAETCRLVTFQSYARD